MNSYLLNLKSKSSVKVSNIINNGFRAKPAVFRTVLLNRPWLAAERRQGPTSEHFVGYQRELGSFARLPSHRLTTTPAALVVRVGVVYFNNHLI